MVFKIINNRAFTEDNVLIYNIMVCYISVSTSKWRIREYFERFGKVLRVRRVRFPKTTRKFQRMLIDFKHPEDAAKVLQRNHTIKSKELRVFECFRWDQPDGVKVRTAVADADANQHFRLLHLNDDCLVMIFRALNPADQLNLAQTDIRLKAIFKLNARREYETMELDKFYNVSVEQMHLFFKMAGRYVREIFGLTPSNQLLQLIGLHCPNLKRIKFTDYLFDSRFPGRQSYIDHEGDRYHPLTANGLDELMICTSLLTQIELEVTCLQDESICLLTKLCHLKALSVASNFYLSGKYIAYLSDLEMLSLNSCYGLEPSFFHDICKSLSNLKAFDIQNCSRLTTADFKVMVNHLPGLETLKVSVEIVDSRLMTELPCLKNLYLESSSFVPVHIIRDLASYMSDQLELLELDGFWCNSREIIPIIGEISSLKILHCSSCIHLDDYCLDKLAYLSNLRELNISDCYNYTEMALMDLMRRCSRLGSLKVVGCNHLTEDFFKEIYSLFALESKQGNVLRHPKITTSNSLYHEYSLDKFNHRADGIFSKRIFEWDFEG